MHREDHNTKLSTNVRPFLTSSFSPFCLSSSVPQPSFLRPSFSSCSLTAALLSVSLFLCYFCCPADLNVGTTSLQLASMHGEVTETLREHSPGPRVCASACPSSSSSSRRSPPSVHSDEIRMYWFCRFRVWWLQDEKNAGFKKRRLHTSSARSRTVHALSCKNYCVVKINHFTCCTTVYCDAFYTAPLTIYDFIFHFVQLPNNFVQNFLQSNKQAPTTAYVFLFN